VFSLVIICDSGASVAYSALAGVWRAAGHLSWPQARSVEREILSCGSGKIHSPWMWTHCIRWIMKSI